MLFSAVFILVLACHPAQSLAENTEEASQAEVEEIPYFWSRDEDFRWYYQTELEPEKFSFLLNGQVAERQQLSVIKYKDYLHAHIQLHRDENTLTILREETPVLRLKLFYAPSYEAEAVPAEALAHYFHARQQEEPCIPCHRMTPNKADIIPVKAEEQICYSCHKHMFDNLKSKHKPAEPLWLCLLCHQMQEREVDDAPDTLLKYTIEEGGAVAPLCYKCHKKFQKHITELQYIHGPLGMDGCNMCHDPHGSTNQKILQKKPTVLCVECHEMEDILDMPVVHQVINKEGCIACHDPHASNHSLQLKKSTNELCFSCHPNIYKMKNDHPVQGHPVAAEVDPSYKKRPLSCISCHSPHAAEHKNLLPEEEMMRLCARCHTKDFKK